MLFQTLDDKSDCVGIYCDGQLIFDPSEFPEEISKTWKYSSYLRGIGGVEYASLYLQGQAIQEAIPEYLKDDWEDVSKQIRAFHRSLQISKVDQLENCFFDLVPERFLVDFCEVKNDITNYIIKNIDRPPRYDYLLKVCQMLEDISNRGLNINLKKLRSFPESNILRDISSGSRHIAYNQFGTKTGRLTTAKKSFPILTLRKDYRSVMEPVNDRFLEIDFNGAEARVLLGLLGKPQPDEDVHNFHRDEVFSGSLTREQSKTAFFAWLYGAKSINNSKEGEILKRFYDKDNVINQFWDGSRVETPFGKVIEDVDKHHALNYIIQSTTAELTLLQALKVDHLLRTQSEKSFISCIIHDSIVIDLSDDDYHFVEQAKTLMSSTRFGMFKINTSMGNSLGDLEKL